VYRMVYFIAAFLLAAILAPHGALEYVGVVALAVFFVWFFTDRTKVGEPPRP
jgi:hypothetical protein